MERIAENLLQRPDRLIGLMCESGDIGAARHAVSRLVTRDGGTLILGHPAQR